MDTQIFRKTSLFSGVPQADLQEILKIAKRVTFQDGEELFEEKSEGSEFYLVCSGKIGIHKGIAGGRKRFLAAFEAGVVFGESALFDHQPRSAAAVADGTTEVLAFPRQEFLTLLRGKGDVAVTILSNLLKLQSERLRNTNEMLRDGVMWGFKVQS